MIVKVIQINMNRCHAAHDLLEAKVREEDTEDKTGRRTRRLSIRCHGGR